MQKILIIGGGLAGASLAYVLKGRGLESVVLEAGPEPACGASGNKIGLYNPRFTAELTPQAQFYSAAYFTALETFEALEDINWDPCGTLHLVTDEKKARRFPKTLQSWGWDEADMRLVSAEEASVIAGVDIPHEALYLPRSGSVCPQKLCHRYMDGVEVHLSAKVDDVRHSKEEYGADAVVVATGMGALSFPECGDLPLKPVRGQVTLMNVISETKGLRCNLCYGGYMSHAVDGEHVIGSSFQPWLDHSEIIGQDDLDNIEKLYMAVPVLEGVFFEMIGNRAAVRTTAKDHFPLVGSLAEDIYVSTAHGSHGIISALQSAHILGDLITGQVPGCGEGVLRALSPHRF